MRAAGFGFRAGATAQSLRAALDAAGGPEGIALIATAAPKATAAPFTDLARTLGLPTRAIAPESLAATPTLTQSNASLAAQGTGSLAEAAALAAAGPGARLLGPRAISPDARATCAIAVSPDPGETP